MSSSAATPCDRCGTPLPFGTHICPKCGLEAMEVYSVAAGPSRGSSRRIWPWVLGGVGLAVLLVLVALFALMQFRPGNEAELAPITYIIITPVPPPFTDTPEASPTPAVTTAALEAPTLTPAPTATLTAAPTLAPCTNDAAFAADVSIPDGSVLSPGQGFVKTWRLQNTGTCAWDSSYALSYVSGSQLNGASPQTVPWTNPNDTVDISVSMVAPSAPGTYTGQWQMVGPNGVDFGGIVTVVVVVPGPPTAVPTFIPTVAATATVTPAPCDGTPTISSFTASPSTIVKGADTTLSWGLVYNASAVTIDQGLGGVETPGSRVVSPDTTTTYTMLAFCSATGATTIKTVTVQVGTPLPDLYVTDLSFTPSPPNHAQADTVKVTVFNGGNAAAGSFLVKWWAGANYPAAACAWTVPSLAAQSSRVLTCSAPAGTWASAYAKITTRVKVDVGNKVAESNENNNIFDRDIQVK